jgi:hypothetical protein
VAEVTNDKTWENLQTTCTADKSRRTLMVNTVRIEMATTEQLDEIIEVFLSSFKEEATTAAWIDLSSEKLNKAYGTLVRIKLKLYLEAGNPIFIAIENNSILGLVFRMT